MTSHISHNFWQLHLGEANFNQIALESEIMMTSIAIVS